MRIDRDAGRDRGVDAVELGCRRGRAVAGRVGGADAGVDGKVGIGRQIAAGDVDAEGRAGDRAGVGGTVDRQGDDVAALNVAADRAGHRHGAAGFRRIEDVVGGDGDRRRCSPRRGVDTVELGCRRRDRVAGRVGGADAGVDGMVGVCSEIAAGDVDAEGRAGDRAGIGGAVHRQGDDVAILDVAANRAGHRDGAAGFGRIEDVVGGDGVHRDAGCTAGIHDVELGCRRGRAVAGGVGGADAGVDGMVGIRRQIAAGDVDAEGRARDRAGVGGAVDCQGDGVAALNVAADRAGDGHGAAGFRRIEDVVGSDSIDGDARRDGRVDRVEVSCRRGGAVPGRVGGADAGVDGMVGVCSEIAAGDVDAEGRAGDRAGIGGAVDCQRDDVAVLNVAADRAGDGHGAAGFRRIDDVVGSDRIDRDAC